MICPNCGREIIFKDKENTAACKNCGCVLTVSVTAQMPQNRPLKPAYAESEDAKESRPESEEAKPSDPPSEADKAEMEGLPVKKQLNVFGPAAVVLGILTVLFAFLAGIKALVLGIPAVIVSALGLLACYLIKNTKKRLSVSGLIIAVIGIVIAVIIHDGMIF